MDEGNTGKLGNTKSKTSILYRKRKSNSTNRIRRRRIISCILISTKDDGCLGYINTYDFDKPQLTWTTDGANAGTVFLRKGKYNCTNVCGTLLLKSNNNDLRYLKYALEYIAKYHKRPDTNGYKIMNNEMAEIKITLPRLEEQQKIANFLDKKVTQIDHIIKNQGVHRRI